MITRKKQAQLELFAASIKDRSSRRDPQMSFLGKFIHYEKNIILGICFLVVFISAYSLGIEKGKKIKIVENKNMTTEASSVGPVSHKRIKTSDEQPKEKIEKKTLDFDGYTVQVASFRTKTSAEECKERLKKKGFKAYILPKKKYIIVCVGTFKDKTKARLSQNELRRLYDDCLIRKL